jgi:hypothetical protein
MTVIECGHARFLASGEGEEDRKFAKANGCGFSQEHT